MKPSWYKTVERMYRVLGSTANDSRLDSALLHAPSANQMSMATRLRDLILAETDWPAGSPWLHIDLAPLYDLSDGNFVDTVSGVLTAIDEAVESAPGGFGAFVAPDEDADDQCSGCEHCTCAQG